MESIEDEDDIEPIPDPEKEAREKEKALEELKRLRKTRYEYNHERKRDFHVIKVVKVEKPVSSQLYWSTRNS